jgi:hypothetical protein
MKTWSRLSDLNRPHPSYKKGALPDELNRLKNIINKSISAIPTREQLARSRLSSLAAIAWINQQSHPTHPPLDCATWLCIDIPEIDFGADGVNKHASQAWKATRSVTELRPHQKKFVKLAIQPVPAAASH